MVKRVLGLLSRDWTHTRREKILVYMLIVPIVIAVLLRLFLPAAEQAGFTFAVDSSVPDEMVGRLREFGRVEAYGARDALKERVTRLDDVPGIYFENGQYTVLLEGNEGSYVAELSGALVDYIAQGEDLLSISYQTHAARTSQTHQVVATFVAYFCVLIGAIAIGFNLVSEQEAKTIKALAVSPINTIEYIIGKSILALAVSLPLAFACSFVLVGPAGVSYLRLLIAVLSILGLAVVYGFLIGLVAQNQLAAIAAMKSGNLVMVGIPLVAQFLSNKYKWLLYPFPNYWGFESLRRVFVDTGLSRASANALALITTFALLLVLAPRIRKRFQLG